MKPILHIAMLIPGLPFDADTLKNKSLGGSETAGLSMARALRDRGHRIYLFCNIDQQYEDDRIEFIPMQAFQQFSAFIECDVCIIQRMPQMIRNRMQSKFNILWQHDMTLLRYHDDLISAMWNTDALALLSEYHKKQYVECHGDKLLSDDLIFLTRNGIDLDLFPNFHAGKLNMPSIDKRDRKLMIYAARPERGLDYLLDQIMPRLIEKDPEIRLGICGYENPADQLKDFYHHCMELGSKISANIVNFGALPKPKSYELYGQAGLYLYPTPTPSNPKFREISCITMMECMASGLPAVVSDTGALPETLDPEAGRVIEGLPGEKGHDDAFIEAVLELVSDTEKYQKCSESGLRKAECLSWKALAADWEKFFLDGIRAKSGDRDRLAIHFRRRGDNAALAALENTSMPDIKNTREFASPEQSAVIYQWLKKLESRLILDFGQLTELRKQLPECEFHSRPADGIQYDAVVLVNDLEYWARPESRLDYANELARPGGNILICTPSGPFNIDRLWNFEGADYENMIGHLKNFDLFANMTGANQENGDPIGYIFAKFEASDDAKIGPIDMERKLSIQGPRETVSVNIIAGGDKVIDTLHWNIKSLLNIADEILIADCGLSDEALRILKQYPVKICPNAPNPLTDGFEAPRNLLIDQSKMDWILWLDCDEKLIDPEYITKYLRPNIFDGYAIKQHHFGVGITHEPDMPVRLFRNHRGIKFYGRIHEHPEKELNKGPGTVVVLSDVNIMHIGYESEKIRSARFYRNKPLLEMDKRDYPERILQKHMIMRDNMILANNMLARNGNKLDEDIKLLCEETIELWRKYFKGGCDLVGLDSTQYYNNACKVLGIGVDIAFMIQSGRDGYGANLNGQGMRFADMDDLKSEIDLKVKQSAENYLKDYF